MMNLTESPRARIETPCAARERFSHTSRPFPVSRRPIKKLMTLPVLSILLAGMLGLSSLGTFQTVDGASLHNTGILDFNRLLLGPFRLFDQVTKSVEIEFNRLIQEAINSEPSEQTRQKFIRITDTLVSSAGGAIDLGLSSIDKLNSTISPWFPFLHGGITNAITELQARLAEFANKITGIFLNFVVQVFNNTTGTLNDVALNGLFSMLELQSKILDHGFRIVHQMYDNGRDSVAIRLVGILDGIVKNMQNTIITLVNLGNSQNNKAASKQLDIFMTQLNDGLFVRLQDNFQRLVSRCDSGRVGFDIVIDLRIRIQTYNRDCGCSHVPDKEEDEDGGGDQIEIPDDGEKDPEDLETEDPENPETEEPEEPETENPENPEDPETQEPEEPETGDPETQEPEEPETENSEDPENPETEEPEEPETEDTGDPESEDPENPETEEPEEPETEDPEDPENPETQEPEEPETGDPETQEPEEPEIEDPEDPETENPEDPEIENPEDPENEELEEPETENPEDSEIPETEEPEEPEIEDPETQEPDEPETEDPEDPENSETEGPEDPETQEPEEPETEDPEDPENPETEEPKEPETEDPETQEPEAETPEDPETDAPEDPETQEPEEPEVKTEVPDKEPVEDGDPPSKEVEDPDDPDGDDDTNVPSC